MSSNWPFKPLPKHPTSNEPGGENDVEARRGYDIRDPDDDVEEDDDDK